MAVTQTELKSSFLKDVIEEEEYQANIKSIQDWLTSQTQVASSVYQTQAQTAAEQASYDISGAYANYLKQQRNVAAQGRLESGYKEEVGEALEQQYQSAYGQAKATQAQNVASAQASYMKNVQAYQETASKAATSYYESALKEAELRANIYRAAEEYANLEESQFDVYDIDPETGKYTLTGWGYEQLSSALLDKEGGFKTYLEEQKLTDELEYYLADPTGTRQRLFGITETGYNPMSEASLGRRLGTTATTETGEIISYVDTIEKPTYKDMGSYGADQKYIKEELTNYAKMLGLTEADVKSALGGKSINDTVNAFGLNVNKYDDKTNDLSEKLLRASKKKYIKE